MEEHERERLEQMLEAVTLAGSADQVRSEMQELRDLAAKAQAVEAAGSEEKLSKLRGRCFRREDSSKTRASSFCYSRSLRTRWTIWWTG